MDDRTYFTLVGAALVIFQVVVEAVLDEVRERRHKR